MLSLALSAYVVTAAVRAAQPPPLTIVYQNGTFDGPVVAKSCSATDGSDHQVTTDSITISSGHTAYFLPLTFFGAFNVSSSTNPTYNVEFYVNGTGYGSVKGFTQPSGVPTSASFQEPMASLTVYQFFRTGQAGPQTLNWAVDISTASGQAVCVQQWYLNIEVAQT